MKGILIYSGKRFMRSKVALALVPVFAAFLMLTTLALPAVFASGSPQNGYVTYSVTVTNSTHTMSATVNESIGPASGGYSVLSLQLMSSMSNLSYSRLVNSSMAMFPYLPIAGNQSFTYQFHNYSISASIAKTGSGSAKIAGSTYTTTYYTFSVSADRMHGKSVYVSGGLSTLPSGLIYSVDGSYNGATLHVQLLSTDLPLNASSGSSSSSSTMAIIGGTGTVAAGIGAFALIRRERSSSRADANRAPEDKPIYHVD